MRTRGELLFIEIFAAVVTVVVCSGIAWVAYRVLDNVGYAAFFGFCGFIAIASMAYAIRTDIRDGRYEFRDLPGALFRWAPPPNDRD